MEKFFKLKENGTTVGREIVAGLTTFFAMAYIIVVNPNTLSGRAGGLEEELMPWGAVFLATIIASIIGTLVMGLVANVPFFNWVLFLLLNFRFFFFFLSFLMLVLFLFFFIFMSLFFSLILCF